MKTSEYVESLKSVIKRSDHMNQYEFKCVKNFLYSPFSRFLEESRALTCDYANSILKERIRCMNYLQPNE